MRDEVKERGRSQNQKGPAGIDKRFEFYSKRGMALLGNSESDIM